MKGSTTWCQNSLTIFMSPNATLGMINTYFHSLVSEVVFTCSTKKVTFPARWVPMIAYPSRFLVEESRHLTLDNVV